MSQQTHGPLSDPWTAGPEKISAVFPQGQYVIIQLAEVAVPRKLFQKILRLIDDPRPRPAPA